MQRDDAPGPDAAAYQSGAENRASAIEFGIRQPHVTIDDRLGIRKARDGVRDDARQRRPAHHGGVGMQAGVE